MSIRSNRSSSSSTTPHNNAPTITETLRPIKITVVGDGTVGKTCLLISYTQNSFPQEYIPTVFDNHAKTLTVDGKLVGLTVWDTAGQEEYEKLRPLSYPKTDCFIICYAIDNPASFANVEIKWVPELRQHCPRASILLVGTKSDLRTEQDDTKLISESDGKKLKKKIKAAQFLSCSAKTQENLDAVFIEAVRAIMKQKNNKSGGGQKRGRSLRGKKFNCSIL
ncbi:ras-related protein ced-10 [Folsomia candida]|uniref:ras-related protein ced-10 n=1 Tax=Folsomia candida TaxID=158441 RepID=UPI000B8F0A63|nr:ras-related protein ced-10 [Folsomia candida]XP_021957030.1 ras-related protein ced-10 [Folsomia candida]